MRGKQTKEKSRNFNEGLIPAYAGKTYVHPLRYEAPTAHPRVCGENPRILRNGAATPGSSPRMRGKRDHGGQYRGGKGLIPAYAGKTAKITGGAIRVTAHPRVCGENVSEEKCFVKRNGSSPRMRGKQALRLLRAFTSGLIPAYAGKTLIDTVWVIQG